MTIHGLDLSNNNPVANFTAIRAAGYQFCIHKATEGADFVDRYLAPRWREMKAAGVARGCYHYARPSANSATDEAAHFVKVVADLLEPGDSVYLDIEDEYIPVGESVAQWCLDWLALIERHLGVRPGVYTYPSYIGERGLTAAQLGSYPLWWASYSQTMRPAPWPWPTVAIWQYTSNGTVPGTTGRIDLNHLLSDDIQAFLDLGMPGLVAAETENDWNGLVTGRAHWGGDPLRVSRRANRLYRTTDGFDLGGYVLDDWVTTTESGGQLVRTTTPD